MAGPRTDVTPESFRVWTEERLDRLEALSEQLARDAQAALGPGYLVERELGRGGMGTVLLARDLALDRPVAVKVLRPELVAQSEIRERFVRESRIAASFSHPHIVPVHAVIERPETLGFVMGYIDGETVTSRVLRDGPMLVADAVRLLREVAWGLAYAAGRGITHRDVKPDNILLERATGRALLTDFGVARSEAEIGLTGVGQVVGTPHYMSPEQAAGEAVDGRSDIYALGAVAWFALTGSPPYDAKTAGQILSMHLTVPLPSLASRRADLPDALVAIVERCLAKEPGERFGGGDALVVALEPVAEARRGVPLVLRMASQRLRVASSFLVAALTVGPLVAYRLAARGADIDGAVVLAFSLAMALGIVSTMFHGFRTLAMSGFRHDDLRHALQTHEGEREELVRNLNAALELSIKLRSRVRATWVMLLLGLLGVGAATVRMRMMQGGTDALRTPGIVVLVLGSAMVALGLTFLMTTPTRPWLPRRALMSFWAGAGGRWVFNLFTRGVPRATTRLSPDSGGACRSAMTVFGMLTAAQKRELRDVPEQVRILEAEADAIDDRVRELRRTLAESRDRAADSSADEWLEGTRRQLRDDIEGALAAAKARRTTIANTLEQVRLELLRMQAGVGDSGAVRAAVRREA
jgi:serine/threonine-protein kinase